MVSPLYYLLCNFFLGIQALKCYYIAGWQVRTIQLDNLSLFYWVVKSEFSFSSWVFEWYLCFQIDFQSQCLLSHILKCQRINLHSLREEVAVLTVASLAWTRLLGSEIGEQQGTKKWSRGEGGGKVAVIFQADRNAKIQIIMKLWTINGRVLASKPFHCVLFYHVICKRLKLLSWM